MKAVKDLALVRRIHPLGDRLLFGLLLSLRHPIVRVRALPDLVTVPQEAATACLARVPKLLVVLPQRLRQTQRNTCLLRRKLHRMTMQW